METQKIVNFLYGFENKYSKFATKNVVWYWQWIKSFYSDENPIKFFTSSLESGLWDYSDAYVLVTGNIDVAGANNNNTKVFFDSTTLKIVWIKIATFFRRRVSIILRSFSS